VDTVIAVAAYLLPFLIAFIGGYALGRTSPTGRPEPMRPDDHEPEGARRDHRESSL
jgi:hypothetical protein